jgi:hypothetical protein
LDIDLVLEDIPLLTVTDVHRMIFQADPHELLEFRSGSLTGDPLCRVGEDDIIILQTF